MNKKILFLFIVVLVIIITMFFVSFDKTKVEYSKEGKKINYLTNSAELVRWSPDGSLLAVVDESFSLGIIKPFGGRYDYLRESGNIMPRSISWSPDSKSIYFFETPKDKMGFTLGEGSWLRVVNIKNKKSKVLNKTFIEGVDFTDVTPDGNQIYLTYSKKAEEESKGNLVGTYELDTNHYKEDLLGKLNLYPNSGTRLSPDGHWLFINNIEEDSKKSKGYTVNLKTGEKSKISDDYLDGASWSPDNKWIAYAIDNEIWAIKTDGSGITKKLLDDHYVVSVDWSPKGDKIAFTTGTYNKKDSSKLYIMEVPNSIK